MNLPEQFVNRTKSLLKEEWNAFLQSIEDTPPVSIRLNPSKCNLDLVNFEKIKWCEHGYYLPERPSFTFDPLFHAGCYYPQEASSMFIEQVIKQYTNGNIRILDLCAAPGGKSTHLLSLISEDSLLVSNEVIRSRANILSENITKWGVHNAIVTNNDPATIGKLHNYFDVILVDAPCSGEGMFRKDRDAINEWSEANVKLCQERQKRILADVWTALKPNGILIYSTCTFNTEENEDNVQWICDSLGGEPLKVEISDSWDVTGALKGDLPAYRFLPHKTKGEGFFLAAIKKISENTPHSTEKRKKQKNERSKNEITPKNLQSYLINDTDFHFFQHNEKWKAIPVMFKEELAYLLSDLRILMAGIEIGEQKGKDFIPSHSLALSAYLNQNAFQTLETDWQTAIKFLRKEAFILPSEIPKGYILLTYKNTPLGFIKNIGNRFNNLYPQEWRIRSSYTPELAVYLWD